MEEQRENYRSLQSTCARLIEQWDQRIRQTNMEHELFAYGNREVSQGEKEIASTLMETNSTLRNAVGRGRETADYLGEVLGNLTEQGGKLKTAQRTLMTSAGNLGLSNSVIKMISRREFGDRMLIFGLIAVTLVIMYLAWRFL